jgi:hypothetical protein
MDEPAVGQALPAYTASFVSAFVVGAVIRPQVERSTEPDSVAVHVYQRSLPMPT